MRPSKKKIVGIFLVMSGIIFSVSCQEYKIEKKANTAVFIAKDSTKENGSDEFYLWEKSNENNSSNIAVNQLGYRKNDKKIAIVPNMEEAQEFQVLTEDGKVVYTGKLENTYQDSNYNETLSYADFTTINKEGTYYIMCGETIASPIFEISNHVYEKLEQAAMHPFIVDLIKEESGQKRVSLEERSKKVPICNDVSKKVNVSGGWYTNCDEGRYVVSSCTALWNMMYLQQYYQEKFTTFKDGEKKVAIHLEDQIKKELNWLLKMQEKESGGVYHKVTSKTGDTNDTELIVSQISTCATADFSSIMAKGAMFFKHKDDKLSEKYLKASKKAWEYLNKNEENQVFFNRNGIESKEYADAVDTDERLWAATELYLATKDEDFLKRMEKLYDPNSELDFGWKNVTGLAYYDLYVNGKKEDTPLYKKIDEKLQNGVKSSVEYLEKGYQINASDAKKNYQYIMNRGVLLTLMKRADQNSKIAYGLGTKHYLDFLLGANQQSDNVFSEVTANNEEPSIELSSSLLLILQNIA
ncbi:MAG: glycoside hydrolase family 9 protein [bacterium]|nr:glycoside hydrolase family 9 protein [bacterium]